MGSDEILYALGELAVELDHASKANQDASRKALDEVSTPPEPDSIAACEQPKEIEDGNESKTAMKEGKSELHNLFDLASTMAEKADGTEVKKDQFDSAFDAEAARLLKKNGIDKVRHEGDATVFSLAKPITKGDGSGNSIIFGEKNSSAPASRFEFSLTPVSKDGKLELKAKGVNADTILGDIPVTAISLQPRAGGNLSFEIQTRFGNKKGCTVASSGKEVFEK